MEQLVISDKIIETEYGDEIRLERDKDIPGLEEIKIKSISGQERTLYEFLCENFA